MCITITLCYAQTLDGRLAARNGSSQWISGAESLYFAHAQRARHDAIMVGIGTVLADNPRLTVRLVPGHDPLRVVLDSRLRIPLDAAVLRDGAAAGTLIACGDSAPADRRAALVAAGAELVTLPQHPDGGLDLPRLCAHLAARGIMTLMVEGGAQVLTAMLRARLATNVAITIGPKILGSGIAAIGDLGIERLPDAINLREMRAAAYGPDLVIEARIEY
ncbi:MAG: RibD family protein [Oscillochloris sp.]|nr:RibD family protein [Oscillochloris sp.]